ncbi:MULTISPECIES: septum formation family protein [Arthrobacter]|uniref:Septum formation family protein n=2 Tax=Arthrobacter TaxID=1663 RepID=A0ABU9KLC5_9MICC|nr:septum formation family protein [Arthrobacter sp. YJM1]MDP5227706.1 septum formation family protein [Arthrobacter sp. YJM1]
MPRKVKRHVLGSASAAFFAVLLLTSCAAPEAGVGTANPALGQCRLLQSPDEADAVSDPSPPVACTTEHTVETYRVAQLPGPVAQQSVRPNQQQLRVRQSSLCADGSLRAYLAARPRDSVNGFATVSFFPSPQDWSQGARAYRCDISYRGVDGTGSDAPYALDGSLQGIMGRPDSAKLRLCYLASEEPGKAGVTGRHAPCSEPHLAEDVNAWFTMDRTLAEPELRTAKCLPYVLEFLEVKALPQGVRVVPLLSTDNGASTLRCAVGRTGEGAALSVGTLAPLNAKAAEPPLELAGRVGGGQP